MFVCSKCEKKQPASEFHIRPNGKRYYNCKSCQREYCRNHYDNNKKYYIDKAKKNDRKYEAPILEFLRNQKDVPCKDCGNRFPHYVMEFDHVRGTKLFQLSNFRTHSCKLDKVITEVVKCDVVCSNCHQARTYLRAHPEEASSIGVQVLTRRPV